MSEFGLCLTCTTLLPTPRPKTPLYRLCKHVATFRCPKGTLGLSGVEDASKIKLKDMKLNFPMKIRINIFRKMEWMEVGHFCHLKTLISLIF